MSKAEVWSNIQSAPVGVSILTKVDDDEGVRNVQILIRKGDLFYLPDMSMYVYYSPTHWKFDL